MDAFLATQIPVNWFVIFEQNFPFLVPFSVPDWIVETELSSLYGSRNIDWMKQIDRKRSSASPSNIFANKQCSPPMHSNLQASAKRTSWVIRIIHQLKCTLTRATSVTVWPRSNEKFHIRSYFAGRQQPVVVGWLPQMSQTDHMCCFYALQVSRSKLLVPAPRVVIGYVPFTACMLRGWHKNLFVIITSLTVILQLRISSSYTSK